MTKQQFKIGQKVKVVASTYGDTSAKCSMVDGIYKVCEYDANDNSYRVGNDNQLHWFNASDLRPVEKTWETLEQGDVLVNGNRDFDLVVQGLVGEVIIAVSKDDNMARVGSTTELKDNGWKIKDATEPETVELTLSDIAKKFDIPVEKLRVKDE